MDQQIRVLAHLRQTEKNAQETVARLEAELAETPLGQRLARAQDLLVAAKLDRGVAEDNLRIMALARFELDSDKNPHPAVKIAVYTILDYDPAQALEYARQHLPKALKLNKRAFEKAAKAIEPDFVIVGEEPRVRIASDLSEYLKGGNEQ